MFVEEIMTPKIRYAKLLEKLELDSDRGSICLSGMLTICHKRSESRFTDFEVKLFKGRLPKQVEIDKYRSVMSEIFGENYQKELKLFLNEQAERE